MKKEITNNFIKMNGINFYQRDMENQQRYPLSFHIQAAGTKEEIKSARSSESEINAQPDESRIRHSVLKGLWFPIFSNLTNLIMEKRREI